MCGSIGGIGGLDPPVTWGFIEKVFEPPSPGKMLDPPLDPWKGIVFSVIKPLDPLLYIWGSNSENNYVIPYRCANLINTGDSTLKC